MQYHPLSLALRRICGDDAVIDDPNELRDYSHDWIPGDYRLPDLVVFPSSPDQIASVVQAATAAGLPVVMRGAGTGLAGGARPSQGGAVIVTTRLNQIEQVDFANRQAVVQPGLITYDLSAALMPQGWFYAPDPASWKMCTIGGNIANNSGGPRCLKYGVTTNHVLALEVVLHDGRSFWTGDGVLDAAGYDLTGLIVGSEGSFGVVTRALVRLCRMLEANRVVLALFPDVVAACAAVSAILAAGHVPTALEVMDATTMRAVNLAQNAGLPETAGAALIIEIDGVEDGLDATLSEITAQCESQGAFSLHTAAAAEDQERLWSARRSAFASFHTLAPSYYLVDTVVPRTRLPAMMAYVQQLSERYDIPIANVFHAGDGNLHPLALYDPSDAEQVARVHAITADILEMSIREGGAVSGEHGIGVEKQDFLARLYSTAELAAQAAVYAIFNPANQLNPGKVFPRDVDPLALAAAHRAALNLPAQPQSRTLLGDMLAAIVGSTHLLQGESAVAYAVQGQRPGYMVMPGSLDELAAVMAACHQAGAIVTPWGGGTQQTSGQIPAVPDVMVVTRRLNSVLHYDPDDLTIGVGAGMTLAELQMLLGQHNQQFPLEIAQPDQATLGGLIATAADGPRRLGYGALRDLTLGLTVVQADGAVVRLGGQVVKNVSGYDLVKLFLGSHGTLGIIAEVRLRTYPRPPATTSLVTAFPDRVRLDAFLADLAASALCPTAAEYLDAHALRRLGLSAVAGLALRFEGGAAACARQVRDSIALAAQHAAHTEVIDEDESQERLWADVSALSGPPRDATIWLLRLAAPPQQFVTALTDLAILAEQYNLDLVTGGRALNGVIYARLGGSQEGVGALQQRLVERWPHSHILAGALSPQHEMLRWGRPLTGPALELMQQLKQAFDPAYRLNRGAEPFFDPAASDRIDHDPVAAADDRLA